MPTYGLYLSTLVYEFIGIYVRKLSKLYKEDSFIRIALFENELVIEGSRRKENTIYFEGLITIKEKIYQFFEDIPSNIWCDEFYSNNLYQIIGFYKYFNSIESKYTM